MDKVHNVNLTNSDGANYWHLFFCFPHRLQTQMHGCLSFGADNDLVFVLLLCQTASCAMILAEKGASGCPSIRVPFRLGCSQFHGDGTQRTAGVSFTGTMWMHP